jgi:hypothetical protein
VTVGWTIAVLAILAVGFLLWKQYGHLLLNPAVDYVPEPEPLPVHEYTAYLVLPSSIPAFKFTAHLSIKYILKGEVRVGEDIRRVLEWEVHQIAQGVTSQFPLTVSEYLHLALNDRLNAWRWVREGSVGFQAECADVKVDPKDLALAVDLERTKFTLDMESKLHDVRLRNADRLGSLLSEPRTAALWWFAKHPDRVEDLPRITELMFSLDAQLNHRDAVLAPGIIAVGGFAPTSGADLDTFLTGAAEQERTLLLNTLAMAYERLGRPEMAERARSQAEAETEAESEAEAQDPTTVL